MSEYQTNYNKTLELLKENLNSNKIGNKFITVETLSSELNISLHLMRDIVSDMEIAGLLKFRRGRPSGEAFLTEYLEKGAHLKNAQKKFKHRGYNYDL